MLPVVICCRELTRKDEMLRYIFLVSTIREKQKGHRRPVVNHCHGEASL